MGLIGMLYVKKSLLLLLLLLNVYIQNNAY